MPLNAVSQGANMSEVIWEHRIVDLPEGVQDAEAVLNSLGAEGWELVAALVRQGAAAATAYLKRPSAILAAGSGGAGSAGDAAAPQPLEADDAEPDVPAGFALRLVGVEADKARVVVTVAQLCPWLHLKDAKRLVDDLPALLAYGLAEAEAVTLHGKLQAAGAVVEIVAG